MTATLIALEHDDALLRRLRATLAGAGYTVATTRDGCEAARLLETGAFSSAVLSVALPGLSGPQVVERCRRTLGDRLEAVALVADSEQQRIELLAQSAADAVLVQPLGLHDILETMLLLVGAPRSGVVSAGTGARAVPGAVNR